MAWAGSPTHHFHPSQGRNLPLLSPRLLFFNLQDPSTGHLRWGNSHNKTHTWLTPLQSCLPRIIADPRMFSLKTDFSDRLAKHFPCTISNRKGQNYAKHMDFSLSSAARSSLILSSVAHLTHGRWVRAGFILLSAFHAPSGRRKRKAGWAEFLLPFSKSVTCCPWGRQLRGLPVSLEC